MARLQIYDGQDKIEEIPLEKRGLSLGRDEESDIVLPDGSVSRHHASIEPTGNFFLVRDNSSTNGTFVNDMLVRLHLLNHGDTIRVGRYLLRVDAKIATGKESTRVRIEKLGVPGVVQDIAPSSTEKNEATHCNALKSLRESIGYVRGRAELYVASLEYLEEALNLDRSCFLAIDPLKLVERGRASSLLEPVSVRVRESIPSVDELVLDDALLAQAISSVEPVICGVPGGGTQGLAMIAPLIDRDQIRGAIYVDRSVAGEAFGERELSLLHFVCQQIVVSLSNATLLEEVLSERGKIQAIFTSLTSGVIVTDKNLVVTDANRSAMLLLQQQESNPIGRPVEELLSNFRMSPNFDLLMQEAKDGPLGFQLEHEDSFEVQLSAKHFKGELIPYPAGADRHQGYVLTLRDWTSNVRLEQMKTEFIANAAHKLRTPLTVIQANIPMLRECLSTPEMAAQIISDVERNTGQLCHLVDQFVEYTDLELQAAKEARNPAAANVNAIVAQAVRNKEIEAAAKSIILENRLPEDLPAMSLRAGRFRDALERVICNGLKFSDEGTRVTIDAEVAGDFMKIHIIDEGPGIPADQIDAVFFVGHQVDEERTGQVPGVGLGLAIARHTVQESGGEIRITSPYGFDDHGTRVTLILPLGIEAKSHDTTVIPDDEEKVGIPHVG